MRVSARVPRSSRKVPVMVNRSSSSLRTFAMLGAVLALGAGGGAVAALVLGGDTKTIERVVTTPSTKPASDGSALSVNEIYQRSKQAVVEISVAKGTSRAGGSGFVIDKQGHIVTNQHVVSGGGEIQVQFADGRKASAKLVGEDASSDIAVIRVSVPSSELEPLSVTDSSKVQVGDGVVAIGSPFGLAGTVTTGVVSALDRSIKAPNNYTITGTIQTDAPINPGNSGGPLLDSHGNVIGVNSQIDSNSGQNSGVGFAVSSNTVSRTADALISGKKVPHAYMGVSLTDAAGGAGVASVANGSPADDAGLRTGDVITAIDSKDVASSDDAVARIDASKPGDRLTVTLKRGSQSRQATVTLAERPS
jgi:putative serine protease PepD